MNVANRVFRESVSDFERVRALRVAVNPYRAAFGIKNILAEINVAAAVNRAGGTQNAARTRQIF